MSLNQFVCYVERDSTWLRLPERLKSTAAEWLFYVLMPVIVVLAQFVPAVFKKHLEMIFPALPYIKDRGTLRWLRDTFMLYYQVLKVYSKYCLYKKPVNSLMEELDEHIDSLSFVLEEGDSLKREIANIEASR